MSYNVLCERYATRPLYGYCPSWALSWEYRKQAILKELTDSAPDIIALQVILMITAMIVHIIIIIVIRR